MGGADIRLQADGADHRPSAGKLWTGIPGNLHSYRPARGGIPRSSLALSRTFESSGPTAGQRNLGAGSKRALDGAEDLCRVRVADEAVLPDSDGFGWNSGRSAKPGQAGA